MESVRFKIKGKRSKTFRGNGMSYKKQIISTSFYEIQEIV